jgi:ribosome-binding protein aMBF1 (putative translation factor)
LTKRPTKKPLRTASAKKAEQKPFSTRFPERKSVAVRHLAANIKRLRELHDLSQIDLAKALQMEQSAVSLLENARSNPTLLILEQIAKALKVTLGELLSSRE